MDEGAIASTTGLDRRELLASPPARSTAAVAVAASAATAALVERQEDEAMASHFDFNVDEIEKSKGSSF